ncbi:hypothetical protein EDM00_09830 [Ornithobacterium rhinotracheale]|uniref:hypothetical protein n=1 Tax=Ornithobacterium rhinotracheale TaxID=28251 RepID=UPI00129C2F60|nr:hypothetical protein [Ornithobacterium rhinotracheale]MRI64285.1 hypothetical protein [Ornithobacterium rhinotracheale]
MKKFILSISFVLIGLLSFAQNSGEPENFSAKIVIKEVSGAMTTKAEISFDNYYNFKDFNVNELNGLYDDSCQEVCNVEIFFVVGTEKTKLSKDGANCTEVVKTIKELKDQILASIK